MKSLDEMVFLDACQLAQLIREREISALAVLEAHLARIAEHNPALNAIVTLDEERARRRAGEADDALARGCHWGPLHGVPITVKDIFETAGLRSTASYKRLSGHIPKKDATVVARLLGAGAIILGKTNLPRLGMDVQSISPLFGRTCNPWDQGCTPGGSTGGGAASVAAGLSPLEAGSDIAGSIRLPAHFCGVFGLKPTQHRVSGAGHLFGRPGELKADHHLCTYGPVARSVRDLRLALSIIAGPDGRDQNVPPVPMDKPSNRPLSALRIAWSDDFSGVPVTAETRVLMKGLAEKLSGLGCHVERLNPPGFDFRSAWETWGAIMGGEQSASMPYVLRAAAPLAAALFYRREPVFRASVLGAGLMNMRRYMEALARRQELVAAMDRFLSGRDAWLCPVSSTPAFAHLRAGGYMPGEHVIVDGARVPYLVASISYTMVFNLTGHPVVAIPMGQSAEGLPIGVQVAGKRWRDMELLCVAEKISEVCGPFRRPPGY